MAALRTYMPSLAKLLGTTSGALYERQRALVRSGLLGPGEGWGPGSGVRVTPDSVSLLLISVLASESLAISEMRAGRIACVKLSGRQRCRLTHARTFDVALASILASRDLSRRVDKVSVSHTAMRASISYRDDAGEVCTSKFMWGPKEPALAIVAELTGAALRTITKDVMAMFPEKPGKSKKGRTAR